MSRLSYHELRRGLALGLARGPARGLARTRGLPTVLAGRLAPDLARASGLPADLARRLAGGLAGAAALPADLARHLAPGRARPRRLAADLAVDLAGVHADGRPAPLRRDLAALLARGLARFLARRGARRLRLELAELLAGRDALYAGYRRHVVDRVYGDDPLYRVLRESEDAEDAPGDRPGRIEPPSSAEDQLVAYLDRGELPLRREPHPARRPAREREEAPRESDGVAVVR